MRADGENGGESQIPSRARVNSLLKGQNIQLVVTGKNSTGDIYTCPGQIRRGYRFSIILLVCSLRGQQRCQ